MNWNILLALLSISGAAVPFALNNQMDAESLFSDYKVFKCAVCLSFWLALITIALMGGNPLYAGIAPILTRVIEKTLY